MPVKILVMAGYLGAGKSTLLQQMLPVISGKGVRAALLINELGDLNIDGMLLEGAMPTASLVNGCVCCTMRGDFSMAIIELIQEHDPEWILVECTGAANPMELLDALADTALAIPIGEVRVVSVIDGATWQPQYPWARTPRMRLLHEQLRCANDIVLHHTDRMDPLQVNRFAGQLANHYSSADIWTAAKGQLKNRFMSQRSDREESIDVDMDQFIQQLMFTDMSPVQVSSPVESIHHHHAHVMVSTHRVERPVNHQQLDTLAAGLPITVHRGKGILTIAETGQRVLYQYAFQAWEVVPIVVNENAPDTLVWIGEHIEREQLQQMIEAIL